MNRRTARKPTRRTLPPYYGTKHRHSRRVTIARFPPLALLITTAIIVIAVIACLTTAGTLQSFSQSSPRTLSLPSPTSASKFATATPVQGAAPTQAPVEYATNSGQWADLALQMVDLINADRAAERLAPVKWDNLAASVGQAHAEEMAANDYMSHWNLAGEGPDIRYGRAGGTEFVQENVYEFWSRYDAGRPVSIDNWEQIIRNAQAHLMNSPGHRANIVDPAHTHVGIGIAYNEQMGEVRIAQEFLNRYVALDPLPAQAQVGDVLPISGQLLPSTSDPLINLAYEPFPSPVTVSWLDSTSTYASPARFFDASNPTVSADGHFTAQVTLDMEGQSGIYHIRIWVVKNGEQIQAADAIVDVTL